ncbi:transposase, partial [Mesorhizobium sp. M4B.F.Ca.ET.049.02.1.2]
MIRGRSGSGFEPMREHSRMPTRQYRRLSNLQVVFQTDNSVACGFLRAAYSSWLQPPGSIARWDDFVVGAWVHGLARRCVSLLRVHRRGHAQRATSLGLWGVCLLWGPAWAGSAARGTSPRPSATASPAGRRSAASPKTGRLEMTNNAVERAIRAQTLGRRNWTFLGSNSGGERAAVFYTLIQTCKLNGINPEAYLADLIGRVRDHPANRIDELLLWNWHARSGTRLA